MKKLIATTSLLALLGLAALGPSLAQTNDQGGPGFGMMGGGCPMMGMMGQGMMGRGMMGGGMWGGGMWGQGVMGNRMNAIADGRLAYLKTELGITQAQEEAWNGYAKAVKDRVEVMQGLHQTMFESMQKGTALERMDLHIQAMQAMLDAMKDVKPATEKLYAALSADQKKLADDLIGAQCGAM
jgi:hypothetical protein